MQAALLLTGAMASMIGPIRNEQATHVLTDGIRNHQNSNLSKVCELKPNQAPVKFLSQRLQLRIYVYAGVELIGPRSCEAVDIYITDRSLSRQFHRLIFAREGKKEYEFTLDRKSVV